MGHAPTLRTVLGLPGLGLHLHSGDPGGGALDRPVRWVAVSELPDPTPYLEGGELLLTTGLRLTGKGFDAYVARLVDAGVVGLGLGVGLTFPSVPPALARAVHRHHLPLLEVPEPTPFIAVGKAVSGLLAAAEYEAVSRVVAAQRDLTRAALATEGAPAVVARLAQELAAQVLLLDPAGAPLHAAPREAGELAAALAAEVEPLRARGARASAAVPLGDATAVLQPLAPAGRVRGYLAVVRDTPFATADHALINVGVALVSLAMERSVGTDTVRRDLRAAILALLADGTPADRLPIAGLGWAELLAGPVRVLMVDGAGPRLLEVMEEIEEPAPTGGWRGAVPLDGRLAVLVADDERSLESALALVPGLACGVSEPVDVAQLADGLRQARRALAAAGSSGVRHFSDLARHGVVGLVDADASRGFADALLGPLEARDRGDLVASVRAWLAHHGQWDAAATSLGVHRHTLRYRMRRVEELLDRSLDDPDLRADLWVALAVRDRDAAES